jgi:hypothetical protein
MFRLVSPTIIVRVESCERARLTYSTSTPAANKLLTSPARKIEALAGLLDIL